jgi:Lysozyme like domain
MNKTKAGIFFATLLTISLSGSSVATANVSVQPLKVVSVQKEESVLKPLSFVKPKNVRVIKKQLSGIELKTVLYEAGFRGKDLVEAWGTAMKESMGRPFAHNKNSNTGDNSYGLFQINMIGSLGPARLKQFGLKSNKELFNPATNAKIAFIMSNGGKDWSAWHGITPKTKSFMEEFPN